MEIRTFYNAKDEEVNRFLDENKNNIKIVSILRNFDNGSNLLTLVFERIK